MNLNTRIPGANLRGPLTRSDHRADLPDTNANVRSPSSEPSALVQYNYIMEYPVVFWGLDVALGEE